MRIRPAARAVTLALVTSACLAVTGLVPVDAAHAARMQAPSDMLGGEPLYRFAEQASEQWVVVRPGDSLSKIAQAHGTEWRRLFDANPDIVNPSIIHPEQRIRIPAPDEQLPSRPLPTPPPPRRAPADVVSKVPASTPPVFVDGDDVWARLRQCESGGNYATNTGNGYYGAYQFADSTWDSMETGYERADLAPPEVQDDAARRLQARSGWGQWPACTRKLGLR